MRNVAPSRALVRRSRSLLEIAFVIITAGIFITIVGLALFVVPLTSAGSESFGVFDFLRTILFVGGLAVIALGVGLAIRALTWKTENDLAKITGDRLALNVGEDYTFIRNISKRELGYIDAVMVGPAGILVFRIVDFEGSYVNEVDKWLKDSGQAVLKPTMTNPTKEAIDDMKSLKAYLTEHEMGNLPIFGVVVFIKDDPVVRLTMKEPVLPATHLSSLYTRLQKSYLAKERMDQRMVTAVVRLLYGEE